MQEKSRLDWLNYKKDEGLEEELQQHNKDGYALCVCVCALCVCVHVCWGDGQSYQVVRVRPEWSLPTHSV